MTMVTRNVRHLEPLGVPVLDPWDRRRPKAEHEAWDGTSTYELSAPRVDTVNNHGTGCTFAAAAAGAMAGGTEPADALQTAKDYVSVVLSRGASWQLGHGHGPLDHFAGRSHR